jgi:SEC-C motif
MTLILSAISPTWAMQASDRRVTVVNTADQVVRWEDERNKGIFVAERMTFAYTGLADIGGTDTAEWFQAQLARAMSQGRLVEDALQEAAEMAAQYVRALPPYVDYRAHAFVGVGWTPDDVQARVPFIVCLSNSIDEDGHWRNQPGDDFNTHRETLGSHDPLRLQVAPPLLSDEAFGHLAARIGSHLDDSTDPAPVARMLIQAIRDEAERPDSDVGMGVMVNNLPRAPGPPTGDVMLVGTLPERDVRTFTYVPHGEWRGEYLGPLVVSSDGSRMGGFVATGSDVTPDGSAAGFMYRPASAPPPPRAAVGQRVNTQKFGRNDPCWCGSGRKYKRCHGARP